MSGNVVENVTDPDEFEGLAGGYLFEQEDVDAINATATEPQMLMMGELPEEVDPRRHPKYAEGFLQTENQGSIGSCQGNSLTECAEFCYMLATGLVIQFSRMFAYLVTQMYDGIRSDRGSTLSGGTKAGREVGFCPEADAPYPGRYPGWGWVTDAMRKLAAKYKLKSHSVLKTVDEVKQYLGSGIGIVQIGISWNRSMTPDRYGCIRSFSGGGGGHAIVLCGYVTDETVGQRSSAGYWFILKNSWGRRWGLDGFAYVDPAAVRQMLGHRYSVFIGRSDMGDPKPRPISVDFTKKSRFGISKPEVIAALLSAVMLVVAVCLFYRLHSEPNTQARPPLPDSVFTADQAMAIRPPMGTQ